MSETISKELAQHLSTTYYYIVTISITALTPQPLFILLNFYRDLES